MIASAKGQRRMVLLLFIVWLALLITVACRATATSTPNNEGSSASQIVDSETGWRQTDLRTLRSLWIGSLPPLKPDPSNQYADNPQAAALGHSLFFDTRFSLDGDVSCATCHKPELNFTDGLPRAEAIGRTPRGAPSLVGVSYSSWYFWDGRRDSQWAQALTPMENSLEHGGTRSQYVHLLDESPAYRAAYEAIFGALPDFSDRDRFPDAASPVGDENAQAAWEDMAPEDQAAVNQAYANIGKAIAAYERLIQPGPSRFDQYVEALLSDNSEAASELLTEEEIAGLRLFISPQAQCIRCHNGPLFTSHSFHNIGIPTASGLALDYGRSEGVQQVLADEFNCLGNYSDAGPDQCPELTFIKTSGIEIPGAFKVPTLRNVADTAPYMHAGQFETLEAVLNHYNQADLGPLGHQELNELNLSQEQQNQIIAFLKTLSGPLATEQSWLEPPEIVSASE